MPARKRGRWGLRATKGSRPSYEGFFIALSPIPAGLYGQSLPPREDLHGPVNSSFTSDSTVPSVGGVLYYLVRIENECPDGNMAADSSGNPRTGLVCE